MKVVISGGSGLIGQVLAASLSDRAEIVVLSRNARSVRTGRGVDWDPATKGEWIAEVASADAVVNLAGAGIADKRWSSSRKELLRSSRIESTRAIVAAMENRSRPGRPVLVSASAIGWYGSRGDEVLTEESRKGEGFLADLSKEWESEAQRAAPFARVVLPRIGIVLAKEGGALAAMLPIFRLGLGGPLGRGDQWMSWIHVLDMVRVLEMAIEDDGLEGPVNAVAPDSVSNRDFVKALGVALGRPAFMPAPGFALKVILGEMAVSLLLEGQRVIPARLGATEFEFRYPVLDSALNDLLRQA